MRSISSGFAPRGSASRATSARMASIFARFAGLATTTDTNSRPSCVRPNGTTRMRSLFAAIARIAAMISAWCAVNVPSG